MFILFCALCIFVNLNKCYIISTENSNNFNIEYTDDYLTINVQSETNNYILNDDTTNSEDTRQTDSSNVIDDTSSDNTKQSENNDSNNNLDKGCNGKTTNNCIEIYPSALPSLKPSLLPSVLTTLNPTLFPS